MCVKRGDLVFELELEGVYRCCSHTSAVIVPAVSYMLGCSIQTLSAVLLFFSPSQALMYHLRPVINHCL